VSHKPLNDAEKVVWATTFAIVRDRGITNAPRRCYGPDAGDALKEWEEWKVSEAIEHAAGAVEHLREAGPEVMDGWVYTAPDGGVTDYGDVFAMWCDVTGTDPKELMANGNDEADADPSA